MSDEVEVLVVPDPGIVAVSQPDIAVVTKEQQTPVVVESPDIDVVTLDEDVHIVDTIREFNVVTVGEVGPPGLGGTGVTASGLTLRTNRYVEITLGGVVYKLAEVN